MEREILQLLDNEFSSDSEDDLESSNEQDIYIEENIVGLEALDIFLKNIVDKQLDPFLYSINV